MILRSRYTMHKLYAQDPYLLRLQDPRFHSANNLNARLCHLWICSLRLLSQLMVIYEVNVFALSPIAHLPRHTANAAGQPLCLPFEGTI